MQTTRIYVFSKSGVKRETWKVNKEEFSRKNPAHKANKDLIKKYEKVK